ncbi:methylated-DNA--[protein]-cysteine S-methyltransferase [Jannaschia sp. 2305UL9-9]|uniref:methylated-DNA--[protein]-cysteine S-methyltransferase n=1 Tax=Jannaschia sp. 2305UL9-9 TaxID=3121638 RepID=UPI003527F03A
MSLVHTTVTTPLGLLHLAGRDGAVTALNWPRGTPPGPLDHAALPEAREQLIAYFEGRLTRFDLRLAPEGTFFQQEVWSALQDIPYGQTRSYRDIAQTIGKPGGTQAVGQANGRNPIPIIIPCHRVIAADGGIGGFSGGLDIKRRLLTLEGAARPAEQIPLI